MSDKKSFILVAINDAQSTIRAVDVKVGALLAGLLLPLSSVGNILTHVVNVSTLSNKNTAVILGLTFLIFWLLAVSSLIRTLSAINNPANHIVNSENYKGLFYGGGLYNFGWLDTLLNRSIIKANKDVDAFLQCYPNSEEEVVSELTFEHMKLVYIRELKLFRFKASLRLAFIWLLIGMGIYFYSKLG
jgi:hypothetical protein